MSDSDENSISSNDLENQQTEESESEEEVLEYLPPIEKTKKFIPKPRTDKQLEMLKKGRENRMNNIKIANEAKRLREEEEKKALEQKIVSKAISIKKKQIKKEKVLDQISDDDTPTEKIISQIKQPKQKQTILPLHIQNKFTFL